MRNRKSKCIWSKSTLFYQPITEQLISNSYSFSKRISRFSSKWISLAKHQQSLKNCEIIFYLFLRFIKATWSWSKYGQMRWKWMARSWFFVNIYSRQTKKTNLAKPSWKCDEEIISILINSAWIQCLIRFLANCLSLETCLS